MIDITVQFLLQVIDMLPYLIPIILILNLCCAMLFGNNG